MLKVRHSGDLYDSRLWYGAKDGIVRESPNNEQSSRQAEVTSDVPVDIGP